MAVSPSRRHQMRVRAARESSQRGADRLMDGAGLYEQLMMQLQADRLRLKQIQSGEGKAQLKAELIGQYDDYVAGVLDSGQGAEDALLTEMLVWNLDIGRYDHALNIARYVLAYKLPMPDRFARTTGCLVAEEIAEAALAELRASEDFPQDVLLAAAELTAGEDMPDEVRAKLHLAIGRGLLAASERPDADAASAAASLEQAITHLKRAIELHGSCGGKKDLERAERLHKKQAPPQAG